MCLKDVLLQSHFFLQKVFRNQLRSRRSRLEYIWRFVSQRINVNRCSISFSALSRDCDLVQRWKMVLVFVWESQQIRPPFSLALFFQMNNSHFRCVLKVVFLLHMVFFYSPTFGAKIRSNCKVESYQMIIDVERKLRKTTGIQVLQKVDVL